MLDTAEGVVVETKRQKTRWASWLLLNRCILIGLTRSHWMALGTWRVTGRSLIGWDELRDLFPSGTTFDSESVSSTGEKTRAVVFT